MYRWTVYHSRRLADDRRRGDAYRAGRDAARASLRHDGPLAEPPNERPACALAHGRCDVIHIQAWQRAEPAALR